MQYTLVEFVSKSPKSFGLLGFNLRHTKNIKAIVICRTPNQSMDISSYFKVLQLYQMFAVYGFRKLHKQSSASYLLLYSFQSTFFVFYKFLADQLTLSQLGAHYNHLITTCPPGFSDLTTALGWLHVTVSRSFLLIFMAACYLYWKESKQHK